MTHHYILYGLRVRSSAPLDGLVEQPAHAEVDLTIYDQATPPDLPLNSPRWRSDPDFGYSDDAPAEAREQPLVWSDDGAYLQWRLQGQMALIFARDGSRLYTRWSPGVALAMRSFNIYGPGMGMIFKLRGIAVLHASVIAIGGQAIAFAGVSGAGKSTLAAVFEQTGFPVVSDDLCVLMPAETGFRVPPGIPRVRLLPDAAEALYRDDAARLTRAADGVKLERTLHWADGTGVGEALPLTAIYLITGRSNTPQWDTMPAHQALFALMSSMYLHFAGGSETRGVSFAAVGALVRQVTVASLITPHGHDNLKKLCRALAARHSG